MVFTSAPGSETYYRFSVPLNGSEIDSANLPSKWFEPGKKYRFSGKLSLQHFVGVGAEWHSSSHNIDSINFRTEASKSGQDGWYGGVNTVLWSGPTTIEAVVDDGSALPHYFERQWNTPKFIDFSTEFVVENDAEAYYLSFQIYPKDPSEVLGACLCLKDLRLEKVIINGSINIDDGLILWNGVRGNGEESSDQNLIFRVGKNGAYLKGKIEAETGSLGGFLLEKGELSSSTRTISKGLTLTSPKSITLKNKVYYQWKIPSLD
jgi:hypothetical protein